MIPPPFNVISPSHTPHAVVFDVTTTAPIVKPVGSLSVIVPDTVLLEHPVTLFVIVKSLYDPAVNDGIVNSPDPVVVPVKSGLTNTLFKK